MESKSLFDRKSFFFKKMKIINLMCKLFYVFIHVCLIDLEFHPKINNCLRCVDVKSVRHKILYSYLQPSRT